MRKFALLSALSLVVLPIYHSIRFSTAETKNILLGMSYYGTDMTFDDRWTLYFKFNSNHFESLFENLWYLYPIFVASTLAVIILSLKWPESKLIPYLLGISIVMPLLMPLFYATPGFVINYPTLTIYLLPIASIVSLLFFFLDLKTFRSS